MIANLTIRIRRPLAGVVVLAVSLVAAALPGPGARAQDDTRELVELAPDIRDQFLAEMRLDLTNLNDVIAAIAAGEYEEAARLAERRMGFAHRRIEMMEQSGASDAEIAAAIKQIRAMAEENGTDMPGFGMGGGMGRGMGGGTGRGMGGGTGGGTGGGMGRGMGGGMGNLALGRFMPEELRALGMAFHSTAYPLADAARAVDKDPSGANYQQLLSALNDMTISCVGCHEVYRVK